MCEVAFPAVFILDKLKDVTSFALSDSAFKVAF